MIRELGRDTSIRLFTDFMASKRNASRVRLGTIVHLDTGFLWIQHHLHGKNIQVLKVMWCENKAHIGTKDVSADVLKKNVTLMNFEEWTRRHPKALRPASETQQERSTSGGEQQSSCLFS